MCDRAVFNTRDAVALHVVNVNPFLYRYRITARGFPVVETAPGEFFATAFGVTFKKPAVSSALSVPKAGSSAAPIDCYVPKSVPKGKPQPKPEAPREALALKSAHSDASFKMQKLKTAIDSANNWLEKLDEFIAAQARIVENNSSKAGNVYLAAQQAERESRNVEESVTTMNLAARIKVPALAVEDLTKSLAAAMQKYAECKYVTGVAADTKELSAQLEAARARVQAIAEQLKKLKTEREATHRTIQDPHNFYITRYLGPYASPQVDSITIERKGAKAGDTEFTHFATLAATFGKRSRMSLGAGFAWAPMFETEYTTIKTLVPPQGGRPGDTLRTVVSQNRNAKGRVPPMFTLTTRVAEIGNDYVSSTNAVVGATIKRDQGTTPEFYGGVSMGLFNDWLFLSWGGYVGTVNRLAPGVSLGQILPTESTVPTSKELMVTGAGMIYFRIILK